MSVSAFINPAVVPLAVSAGFSSSSPQTNYLGSFRFSYPADWRVQEVGSNQALAIYPTTSEVLADDAHFTYIWVYTEPTLRYMPADALDEQFERDSTLNAPVGSIDRDVYLPSFHLLSKEDATLLTYPGRRYIYTAERRSRPVQGETIKAEFNHTIYTVSYQAMPGDFDRWHPVFDAVLQTLQFVSSSSSSSAEHRRTTILFQVSSSSAVSRQSSRSSAAPRRMIRALHVSPAKVRQPKKVVPPQKTSH